MFVCLGVLFLVCSLYCRYYRFFLVLSLYPWLSLSLSSLISITITVTITKHKHTNRADLVGRLGVPEAVLQQPPLLGEKTAESLQEEFVSVVKARVDEWCGNILAQERREFAERSAPPPAAKDGLFASETPVILFQIINQQFDVASMSRSPPLVRAVLKGLAETLRNYQAGYTAILDAEEARIAEARKRAEKAASRKARRRRPADDDDDDGNGGDDDDDADADEDHPPGHFLEYLMLAVNAHARAGDYTAQLADRLRGMLRAMLTPDAEATLADVEGGFRAVVRRATSSIVSLIFGDVTQLTDSLFMQAWYDEDPLRHVVATFADYAGDLQRHMAEYHYTKLMYELLDRTLGVYLNALLAKGASFRQPAAARRIDSDRKVLAGFFGQHLIESRVNKSLQVIVDMQGLASGDVAALVSHCTILKQAYPDITSSFVERILLRRSDLSPDKISQILEKAGPVLATQPLPGSPASILAKLPRFAPTNKRDL